MVFNRIKQLFLGKDRMPDIDIGALQRRCTMGEKAYILEAKHNGFEAKFFPNTRLPGYYLFKNNGAKILAVAHLDTVLPQHRQKFKSVRKDGKLAVISSELDDRLGAYIILDYLKKFNVQYDILLTTNEEKGASTADEFARDYAGKLSYNWIFEFDRGKQGKINDTVLYEYGNDDFEKIVKEFFTIGDGSFTDICELNDFKAAAMNIGCGYQRPHSADCFVELDDIKSQVKLFLGFYDKNKDKVLPFELVSKRWSGYSGYRWDDYDDYRFDSSTIVYDASVKSDCCEITMEKVRVEDLRLVEFEDFSVVSVHKYFINLLVDEKTECYSSALYDDLCLEWWNLSTSEQEGFIEDNFFKSSSKVVIKNDDTTDDFSKTDKSYEERESSLMIPYNIQTIMNELAVPYSKAVEIANKQDNSITRSSLSSPTMDMPDSIATEAMRNLGIDPDKIANRIQCDICDNWFRIPISTYPVSEAEIDSWVCTGCTKRTEKSVTCDFKCTICGEYFHAGVNSFNVSDPICPDCYSQSGMRPENYSINSIQYSDSEEEILRALLERKEVVSSTPLPAVYEDNLIITRCDVCGSNYDLTEDMVMDDEGVCQICTNRLMRGSI